MKDDFLQLLSRLNKAGVDYVVIGGFASVFYGSTIVTQDLDIACDFQCDNILRLAGAISDLNPVHRMTPNKVALKPTLKSISNLKNLYLDTKLGQLDCVGFVEGLGDYEHVKAAGHEVRIQGVSCNILNIEALIKAKQALGRKKDEQVVAQLKALKDLNNRTRSGEQ